MNFKWSLRDIFIIFGRQRRLLGNLHALLLYTNLFLNQLFLKSSIKNTIRVSKGLDPDQAERFVGPDMGPKCLQRLSVADTGKAKL